MKLLLAAVLFLLGCLLAGCSAKDPVTQTPVYHTGTPTNRSSTNSWELNSEPANTQPGRYHGKPAPLRPIPSQRGFELNDPVARAVLAALSAAGQLPTEYLSVRAKHGAVILAGSVATAAQKSRAEAVARAVPGVTSLDSTRLLVSQGK